MCCTNLLGDLDPAVMRRFQWKVQFKAPSSEQRLRLFQLFFNISKKRMTKALRVRLKQLRGLTPGDFKAVHDRIQYHKPKPDLETIIDQLAKELEYREPEHQAIGF